MHYRVTSHRFCEVAFLSGLIVLAGCPDDGATTVTAGPTGTDAGTSDTTAATADGTVASDVTPTTTPTDGGVDPETGPGVTTVEPSATEPATTEPATTEPVATDTNGDTDTATTTSETTDTTQGTDTTDTGSTSTGEMAECEPGELQACAYSGPARTENVGVCVAGARTCDAEGFFGECEGEVVPAVDTCNGAGDEACDGGGDELCGELQWKRTFGSGGQDEGRRIAFDGAGNLVLIGYATGTVDLGGGPLAGAGGTDLVMARYAPDGAHLWSKRFGDASDQSYSNHALAVDAAGNILVGGETDGNIDLGGGPLVVSHTNTAFVARFAPDGSHVWSKQLGGGDGAYGGVTTLAFDGAGDVLLGGSFTVSIDLGGGVVNAIDGGDAFVAKYGPDGAFKWGKAFGGAMGQATRGVVARANGDVCIAGVFSGGIDLGLGVMASAGDLDVFVGCLDPQGQALWAKRFGSNWTQQLNTLAIDAEDRLTFAGETGSIVDFGGGPLGENMKWHAYVARLDGEGQHVWSSLVVPSIGVYVRGVAIDGFGSLVIVGDFHAPTDFGDGPIGSLENPGIYVIKLDSAGKRIWYRVLMSNFTLGGFGAAGSHDGRAAVVGDFQGKIDLGDGWTSSKGGRDGVVAVFAP